MIKVLSLLGSPRKKGNTAYLTDRLGRELDEQKFETERIRLFGKKIKPCSDCRDCKQGELICTIKDEMKDLYGQLEQAEILVFSTPIYWFGPTASMKLLIDRLRPYYGNKRLEGKHAVVLLAAGSGSGDCDLTTLMFKRIFSSLGINFLGVVISKSYDLGEAEKDKRANAALLKLCREINSK